MTFGAYTTTDEVLKHVDLKQKFAIITGGTTGLGLETARALASVGAEVLFTARNRDRGAAAETQIRNLVPGAKVSYELMALDDLASVRAFAEAVLSKHKQIDLLINNAGLMGGSFRRTNDGFELQFGTNYLGHFLLTNLLMPAILRAAPARIVCLSSAAHHWSDIKWDDINYHHRPYDKWEAYGQSKTAMLLFAVALDKRLSAQNVNAYAVHPGAVQTELNRHYEPADVTRLKELASVLKEIIRKQPPAGASGIVWAATAPELAGHGGVYIEDCHLSTEGTPGTLLGYTSWSRDPASAARLWSVSEDMVGQKFPLA